MALSCFTPCGLLELSSRPPLAESIYEQIKRSHGPAYDSETFYGVLSAKWYAQAMAFAAARKALERAKNQADPLRCYDLLASHERHYRIVPEPNATLAERHAALAAAMQLFNGPRRGNVEYQLRTLLGDDFVAWVTRPYDRNNPGADDPSYPANFAQVGIFGNPATWKTIAIAEKIDFTGTSLTLSWSHVAGDDGPLLVGDELVVQPGDLGQQEKIVITARTASTLTATFARPHEAGVQAIRRPWPFWLSVQMHSAVVVKHGRASDQALRQKVSTLLHRLLAGTATWDIVEENASAGTAGPMIPGAGTWKLGQTPLGTLTV